MAEPSFRRRLTMTSGFMAEAKRAPRSERETGDGARAPLEAPRRPRRRRPAGARQLRYVVAIALKYRRYGVPVSELIAEGNFGVVHALGKFDPERGIRFVTYAAYWVRAYMLDHVIKSWSMVGGGSGTAALAAVLQAAPRAGPGHQSAGRGRGRRARAGRARRCDSRRARAAWCSGSRRATCRSTSSCSTTSASGWSTCCPRTTIRSELARAAGRRRREERRRRGAVGARPARALHRRASRLMADPADELSLAEIGRSLGVSRERARQLEARTKRKLKSASRRSETRCSPSGSPTRSSTLRPPNRASCMFAPA